MKYLLTFSYLCLLFRVTFQQCVWYRECNYELTGKIQNCPVEGGPFPMDSQEGLNILKRKCPFLVKEFPGNEFCCDTKQLRTMQKKMDMAAAMFERCPTCIANLNQHICSMVCSPRQRDFMKAVEIRKNEKGLEYIQKVDFYLSKEYKETTYDSCKEVTTPSSGKKAIELACGVWGAAFQCTAERWFEYFGDYQENILAPFDINYDPLPNSSFKPLEIKTLPCNESYESLRACSCSDCEASCTIPFEHDLPPEPFLVGTMDGAIFVMIIVFGVLGTVTLPLLLHYHYFNTKSSSDQKPTQKKGRCFGEIGNKAKLKLEKFFTKWGTVCARNPILVFVVSACVIAALAYGTSNLRITTDATEIWASPTSKSRLDKTYFDSNFTPFYRTNQVFLKSKGLKAFNWTSPNNVTFRFGPAFNVDFLRQVYHLQMDIQKLGTENGNGLEKICFAPMKNDFFNSDSIELCAVQSVWGYLNNDVKVLDNPRQLYQKLQACLRNNYNPDCLAPYGGPVFSPLAVGGHQDGNGSDDSQNNYLLATGVSLTFMVNNAADKADLEPALTWEKLFIDFMKNWTKHGKPKFMEVAFSAERSIQDEIERESKAEMTTIIISYIVMFVYITLSFGRIKSLSSFLLDTKFTLGFGGIVIVLASVMASLGVFGYLGVTTTLLTIEVIPFLVLAVGVDNIFILVHSYHREKSSDRTIEENVGLALGKVGPSILLTSTSEAACFLIGTLSDMPAVKTFAEYSSLAIILNFLLQISCFVSLLAIDSRRQKNNYADILCCIKLKKTESEEKNSNLLYLITKNYYGPFLLKPWVRIGVIMVFMLWLCASMACIPHIEKGLDQTLSMPEDSYVIDYFRFMQDLLSVGPPVYFVIKSGINYTNPVEANAVCGSVGCDSDSLVTYLTRASRLSNISYLASSPSSWIDDYFDWLQNSYDCCKEFPGNGSFCPHQRDDCDPCEVDIQDWRPSSKDFKKYLPYFLADNPDLECPKAGHAAYAGGVRLKVDPSGELQVHDNYFMAYHTSLKTSRDFYMALDNSRKISAHLSRVLTSKLNRTIEVFPYSIFYVYYEQYLTIVEDAFISLSLSLLAVFGMTFLFTGFDLKSSCLVLSVVTSLLINMTAMLYWWDITLNAISLVNLLVAVGIGVEFCSHIVHAFSSRTGQDRTEKALHAISIMGTSVFSGITLTKFLGITVLAFAQTLMLRVFYFRMYLGIVLMGAAHGLVLMPVILSYIG